MVEAAGSRAVSSGWSQRSTGTRASLRIEAVGRVGPVGIVNRELVIIGGAVNTAPWSGWFLSITECCQPSSGRASRTRRPCWRPCASPFRSADCRLTDRMLCANCLDLRLSILENRSMYLSCSRGIDRHQCADELFAVSARRNVLAAMEPGPWEPRSGARGSGRLRGSRADAGAADASDVVPVCEIRHHCLWIALCFFSSRSMRSCCFCRIIIWMRFCCALVIVDQPGSVELLDPIWSGVGHPISLPAGRASDTRS
jgi:hypothetical protein